ncbi:MAG TPA: LysR family transcriptional regulator, partial [Rhizomicrobium sp.]
MDWDKLRIFHAVASAGSFTHAGQMLALSQSAVSRQISALEDEITTPLFQRHARGLTLTPRGPWQRVRGGLRLGWAAGELPARALGCVPPLCRAARPRRRDRDVAGGMNAP